MKNLSTLVLLLLFSTIMLATDGSKDLKKDFVLGDPGISSIMHLPLDQKIFSSLGTVKRLRSSP